MSRKMPECRADPRCPLACSRDYHLCCLIFDYHADDLPCRNTRAMTVDTAKSVLRREAERAAEAGKKSMLAVMLGGESFERFEELRTLCEWAWTEEPSGIKTEFELTSAFSIERYGEILSGWYVDNRDKVQLWLRCNALTIEIAKFAQNTGCGIELALDYDRPEETVGEIRFIVQREIPVRFAKLPPKAVSGEKIETLFTKLQSIPELEALPSLGEICRLIEADTGILSDACSGLTYDTNGYCWPCPELSPVRLHSRDLDELLGKNLENTSCTLNWFCPGERQRAGNAWECHWQIRCHQIHLGLLGMKRLDNPVLIAHVRKMLSDRHDENMLRNRKESET